MKKDDDSRSFWERQFESKARGKNKFKEYDIYNMGEHTSTSSSDSSSLQSEDDDEKIGEGEYTLFHYACSAGDPEIFTYVRDKCSDLMNFLFDTNCNQTKETPLHWAVSSNQTEITKMLIEDMKSFHVERV